MKENLFIGREKELERLNTFLNKRSASLIVVRGRRRIGKSRLIQEFGKNHRFYTFAGIPPTEGISAKTQRDFFATQLGHQLNLNGVSSTDWSTLFSLLARETAEGKVVLLFDEISWMGSKDPTFLGKLKHAWDLEFKKNPGLILILCGSVSTWIEQNILSSTAFFGRISLQLKLEELPLHACNHFLKEQGFHSSPLETFKLLSVTGGIPWYLEQVQPGINADENIRDLCFRSDGLLFHEFNLIFHDLFGKRGEIYRAIVKALAQGALDFNELCQALSLSRGGTLSEYLQDLIQSGFISRDYTWQVASGKASKLSHFRLSDNYLRFYLKHIESHRDLIERKGFDEKNLSSLPGWNAVMGLQFENLVLKNRQNVWHHLHIKADDIVADNPFFQRKSSTTEGCQIDYLIQTRFNTLFACEMKFSSKLIGAEIIIEMKRKLAAVTLPKRFSIWPVLIHVNGVADSVADSGYFAEIIDFSDLLNGDSR